VHQDILVAIRSYLTLLSTSANLAVVTKGYLVVVACMAKLTAQFARHIKAYAARSAAATGRSRARSMRTVMDGYWQRVAKSIPCSQAEHAMHRGPARAKLGAYYIWFL
jgi:hypothetical protein